MNSDVSPDGQHDTEAPEKSPREVEVSVDRRLVYLAAGALLLLAVGAIALGAQRSGALDGALDSARGEPGVEPTATALKVRLGFGVNDDELSGNVDRIPTSEFSGERMLKIRKQGRPQLDPTDVPIARGEPRLWVLGLDETDNIVDFGVVPADGPTEHAFVLQNRGRGTLEIKEIGGWCGCTVSEIVDTSVAPGEETVFEVSYDPRVSEEFGKDVKKQVYIVSNDPLVPTVEFHFTASVAPLDE